MAPSILRGSSQQTQTPGPLKSSLIQPHRIGIGQEWVPWGFPWSGITWRARQAQARTPYTMSRPPICIALSHIGNPPLSPIAAEWHV
jgi:hypothetical protein